MTLNPIAHIDPWGSILLPVLLFFGTGGAFVFGYAKPVPYNPFRLGDLKYGPVKVAAAGPLSNFVMAAVFGLILRFIPLGNLTLASLLQIIVQINLVLMVINLMPIPPLDGSRIIFPFLPRPLQEMYFRLERYGIIVALLIFFFAFPILLYIINFLYRLIVGV